MMVRALALLVGLPFTSGFMPSYTRASLAFVDNTRSRGLSVLTCPGRYLSTIWSAPGQKPQGRGASKPSATTKRASSTKSYQGLSPEQVTQYDQGLMGETATEGEDDEWVDTRIPITLVSGFLGSGKTTLLKHMLENKQGLRVGVVVNDVAAVNIDAKLIRNDPATTDTVELQNGCACCTMKDELFNAVYELINIANMRNKTYDHIVIETTGVAEPKAIRNNFQMAEDYAMPLLEVVRLDTMVTVVDSSVFLDAYVSRDSVKDRPELGLTETPEDMDAMATGQREVAALLVEQVEYADVVLLNKISMLDKDKRGLLHEVVQTMNPWALVKPTDYSVVDISQVLGINQGKQGVALSGTVDDHREAVEGAKFMEQQVGEFTKKLQEQEHTHDHDHSHDHGHEHSHEHGEEECKKCEDDPEMKHHSHSHSHEHSHEAKHEHKEGECGHEHEAGEEHHHHHEEHSHSHDHSHDHDHSHSKTASQTTAETRFRIGTFVYQRRRPFHPERFAVFVEEVTRSTYIALENVMKPADAPTREKDVSFDKLVSGLLRSKGFLWLASTDRAALYFSHAGRTLSISCIGRWWGTVPEAEWPEGREEEIKADYQGEYKDRRNELVFIGVGLYEQASQALLSERLDECLLSDDEMRLYTQNAEDANALYGTFPSRIEIEVVSH